MRACGHAVVSRSLPKCERLTSTARVSIRELRLACPLINSRFERSGCSQHVEVVSPQSARPPAATSPIWTAIDFRKNCSCNVVDPAERVSNFAALNTGERSANSLRNRPFAAISDLKFACSVTNRSDRRHDCCRTAGKGFPDTTTDGIGLSRFKCIGFFENRDAFPFGQLNNGSRRNTRQDGAR